MSETTLLPFLLNSNAISIVFKPESKLTPKYISIFLLTDLTYQLHTPYKIKEEKPGTWANILWEFLREIGMTATCKWDREGELKPE